MKIMKKLAIIFSFFSICLIPFVSQASAPIYLNGDPNFVRIDSHYDDAYYLDRSSMYIQKYEPPEYIIVVNVCEVRNALQGNTDIAGVKTTQFRYDISSKNNWKMYYSYPDLNEWRYIKPHYTYANNGIVLPAGDLVFYIEYNMPIYGKQHTGLFPSSYYNRV